MHDEEVDESLLAWFGHEVTPLGYLVDVFRVMTSGLPSCLKVTSRNAAGVILDWMLPGRDGPQPARIVQTHSAAGVVILTAREAVSDRLSGFEAGADDYIAKPFVMAELIARVRAVLRRMGAVASTVQVGDLVVDEDAGLALRAGQTLPLTATEFRLLAFLATNRGRVMS